MAVKFNAIKCPECGASLTVEDGREKIFCSYCGEQVVVTNENEFVYRHVDEAGVKKAETERIIRMKELEIEEKEGIAGRLGRTAAYVVALVFCLIGALVCLFGNPAGMFGICIGIYIAFMTFVGADSDKQKRVEKRSEQNGMIKISDSAAEYDGKDYRALQSIYSALGFTNIKAINLGDLKNGRSKKLGIAEELTIDGEEPSYNTWYPPDASVIITYHGCISEGNE